MPLPKSGFDESEDALAGKIIMLQMTNFMCHSNLELRFNNKINIITGRNGSGKSAFMAALIVVLGGSANLTGRGSGISDFIKKGESWAKVSLALSNQGQNAYKREVYGSKVTITRTISKNGGSMYICASESGNIISKKKGEIDAILLKFNWQINNPVCVLNQDAARSFLCATDNKIRYTMFAKATQLENLETLYIKTLELLSSTKRELSDKEKGLEEASTELVQLKEKLALFMALEKHVHGKRNIEDEYLWALVSEEEKNIERIKNEMISLEKEKQNVLVKIADLTKAITQCDTESGEFRDKLRDFKESENLSKSVIFSLRRKLRDAEMEIRNVEDELDKTMSKKEKKESEIEEVKNLINKCDANSTQIEEEKKRINNAMILQNEELTKVRNEIFLVNNEYNAIKEDGVQYSKKLEILKCSIDELERNKKRLEILVASGKGNSDNDSFKYGQFTQHLLRAIEEAADRNVFVKKPIGPCGMYVSLSGDFKWARAVESIIGDLMTAYCCDNEEDFQALNQIMDKICGENQPNIIISRFLGKRHDVESKRALVGIHPSVLDVLTFKNDVVFNAFVDQARIETVVLFETDKQASSLMTCIQNVPKNLKMGLTLACDEYYPAPNYRTYYGNSTAPLRYFNQMGKGTEALEKSESDLMLLSRTLNEKKLESSEISDECFKVSQSLQRLQENLKRLKKEEKKIQVELNQLKDHEDCIPEPITKVALEEELTALEKNCDEFRHRISEHREALELFVRKKDELNVQINNAEKELNSKEREVRELEKDEERKNEKYQRLTSEKRKEKLKEDDINGKQKQLNDELHRRNAELEKKLKVAEKICPERKETKKSPEELEKLLEKCDRFLKAAEHMTGNKEETIASYKTKLEAFKKIKKNVDIMKATMESLAEATGNKLNKLKILKTHTACLISFHFQAILQTRGYDGHLVVDFANKTLDLEMIPMDNADPRKDSKTFSGGERSYVTVAFILAIWKAVNMPVYFLDEFDVFMDDINRRVTTDLLLEHAAVENNKQFIFITPHDISSIYSSTGLSVFRLPDPKRKIPD